MTTAPFYNIDVLLVDDEAALLDLLDRQLLNFGYQYESTRSAEKTLELFDAMRFNIVVSDVPMGGVDDLTFAQKLRGRFFELAIIFVTGKPNSKGLDVAHGIGAIQYIVKPVDNNLFAETVATAARWNMAQLLPRAAEKYHEIRSGRMGLADGKLHRIKAEIKNILMANRDAELVTQLAYSTKASTTGLFGILDEKLAPMLGTV